MVKLASVFILRVKQTIHSWSIFVHTSNYSFNLRTHTRRICVSRERIIQSIIDEAYISHHDGQISYKYDVSAGMLYLSCSMRECIEATCNRTSDDSETDTNTLNKNECIYFLKYQYGL